MGEVMKKSYQYLKPIEDRPGLFTYKHEIFRDYRMIVAAKRGEILLSENGYGKANPSAGKEKSKPSDK